MYRIDSETRKKLLSLPETGMGYQIVTITHLNNIKKKYIIINATYAIPNDIFSNNSSMRIDDSLVKETLSNVCEIELSRKRRVLKAAGVNITFKKSTHGAKDSKIEKTLMGECFIRFSPYKDDIRIDMKNKRVLPGTFATTILDGEICLTERLNIIERYALPSTKEIEYAFYINPMRNTDIQRGIVQPAFDNQGGGEEVIFSNGTTDNTIAKIEKLK